MGGIFFRLHKSSPRFGAKLVFVLQCHKIIVFVYNSGRRIDFVDFSIYFSSMLVTSWISRKARAGVHLKMFKQASNRGR